MKLSMIFLKIFTFLFIMPSNHLWGALGTTILVNGVVTNELVDNVKGYVLIRDSLGQKYLLPKKYLENDLKINFKNLPMPFSFEMEISDFNNFRKACLEKYKNHLYAKKCPIEI